MMQQLRDQAQLCYLSLYSFYLSFSTGVGKSPQIE